MKIINNYGQTWDIETAGGLSHAEIKYIKGLQPAIFCNDLTATLWAFDCKMPGGRWLENISFSNDLKNVNAYIAV